jgi:hypothetical protein
MKLWDELSSIILNTEDISLDLALSYPSEMELIFLK